MLSPLSDSKDNPTGREKSEKDRVRKGQQSMWMRQKC